MESFMKNILIISSSPRREGNSDLLCDEFARGARDAGHTVEKVRLADLTIHYCTGCGYCNKAKRCAQQDDMAGLLDKMVGADVIVLASPIYFYAVCGQMKTMIDRCCPRYESMTDKEFYYLFAAAEDAASAVDKAVVELQGFLDCLDGSQLKGVVGGVGAWQKGEIVGTPHMQLAYDMGHGV